MTLDDPVVVDASWEGAHGAAVRVLRAGGTVVLPTDTVYGVAALPSVPGATDQLFALKGRSSSSPLAVLVADIAQALTLVEAPPAEAERWMGTLWPGPLTLVLRRNDASRALELGGAPSTIGVRCPDHDFVRALAAEVGPIAATSANRTGDPTPTTAAEAASELRDTVDLVIDGGPAGVVASTVVDASSLPPRILRVGSIDEAALA